MATIESVLHGFTVATSQGSLGFCSVTLIRGTKNTLVDVAQLGRREILVQKLKEHGLTPADIDQIFLTHAHWDHSLNVDVFPNARILIDPLEREYCKAPKATDWATPLWTAQMLEAQQVQEVREGEEIDDGVTVISIPGHSRGTQGVLIRNGNDTVTVCGDALPSSYSVKSGMPRLVFWDADQAKNSIRKLLDRANVFYCGHDRPFRIEDGQRIRYLEQTGMSIFGWPDPGDDEGPGAIISYGVEPARQARIVE